MVDITEQRQIHGTGVHVSRMGLGGAHLAHPSVPPAEADALIRRALHHGIRYLDTAPLYGVGESERRFRDPLATLRRDDFTASTKVGRLLDDSRHGWHFDFSGDGVRDSHASSIERLGLERVDILYIHDADDRYEAAIREAFPALRDLRAAGTVRAIGAGMNQWQMELRLAQEGDFDCFLLAGRYTLLEQEPLAEFFPYCEANGIAVIAGGPYNSGILASDLGPAATYNYRAAPPEILAKARRIKAVCDRFEVPLKAAALQFVLAHPVIASVIPGAQAAAEVDENVAMATFPIPSELWSALKQDALIDEDAPTPR